VNRVNHLTDLGHSPLHAAIYLSQQERYHLFNTLSNTIDSHRDDLPDKLLKKKIKDTIDVEGYNELVEIISMLLEYTNNIDQQNHNGETAFYLACSQGMTDIARLLQLAGASMTRPDYMGCSPLAVACINGRLTTVTWILDTGVIDVNGVDDGNHTALYRACESNEVEIIKKLIARGANVNLCNNSNVSPLSIACRRGHIEVVRLLLSVSIKAIRTDLVDTEGRGALHEACEGEHEEIVALLLHHDLDPCIKDVNGNTPLHTACQRAHVGCVRALLEHVKVVDVQNRLMETPLFMACIGHMGHNITASRKVAEIQQTIDIMLSHGADINHQNHCQETALFTVCKKNNRHMANFLKMQGAKIKVMV
jgi:ankyrin repeat protein